MASYPDDAACRGSDAALWYPASPVGRSGGDSLATAAARAICMECPVREECVSEAVVTHERDGIRGSFRFDRDIERRAARAWLTEQSNPTLEAA